MAIEEVPFRLTLTGETAERHEFAGYDGYMSLAGFARTLSLVANYTETGEIRQKGEFPGRNAVRAKAMGEGSLIADFFVLIQQNKTAFGAGVVGIVTSEFLYDIVKRVITRNLGASPSPGTPLLKELADGRGGDLEALAAISESSIRQSHMVIGRGASEVNIAGGFNNITKYDSHTKEYVNTNLEDNNVLKKEFSVASFNANSGYGSVYDGDLNRVIPITMSKSVLSRFGGVFTWGLDQYANKTQGRISINYIRILAPDGTPKRYIVHQAEKILPGSRR